MANINPEFVAQVTRIAEALDSLDYFQLLRVGVDADIAEIRAAYHGQARKFHPDRYHHFGIGGLTRQLTIISKRISEAYVILRDADKRARYRELVSGDARAQNLRFGHLQQEQHKEERDSNLGQTNQGRQMFAQAQAAHARGDLAEAIKSLKMALIYEAGNEHFRATLERWSEESG